MILPKEKLKGFLYYTQKYEFNYKDEFGYD